MNSEEILRMHSISEEEKAKIGKIAEGILTIDKKPVKNPICVIVGGQTGAGKSGLMAYSSKMFPDDNVIILEDDTLRHFYPNEQQISVDFPDEYIAITNQLTNGLTSSLFNKFAQQGYNLIFHQTLKNTRIADEGIVMLRDQGYSIVVRGLAVNNFESRLSMIERCLGQLEYKGYCRNVTTSDHDITYKGMPDTLGYIEENKRYDVFEVFKRGETPDTPQLVYAKVNEDRPFDVYNIATHPEVSTQDDSFGFMNAKDAVVTTREEDRVSFLEGYPERIEEVEASPYLNPTINQQVLELKNLVGLNAVLTGETLLEQ